MEAVHKPSANFVSRTGHKIGRWLMLSMPIDLLGVRASQQPVQGAGAVFRLDEAGAPRPAQPSGPTSWNVFMG